MYLKLQMNNLMENITLKELKSISSISKRGFDLSQYINAWKRVSLCKQKGQQSVPSKLNKAIKTFSIGTMQY